MRAFGFEQGFVLPPYVGFPQLSDVSIVYPLLSNSFSFLGLPVILALYVHHLGLLCRYFVINDQRRQLPAFDATRINTFAVFLDL